MKGKSKKTEEHVDIGVLHIPKDYMLFDEPTKKIVCDNIIDALLKHIDPYLDEDQDRIEYLMGIIDSSIITNEQDELYEMCQIMKDCKTRLNED